MREMERNDWPAPPPVWVPCSGTEAQRDRSRPGGLTCWHLGGLADQVGTELQVNAIKSVASENRSAKPESGFLNELLGEREECERDRPSDRAVFEDEVGDLSR